MGRRKSKKASWRIIVRNERFVLQPAGVVRGGEASVVEWYKAVEIRCRAALMH